MTKKTNAEMKIPKKNRVFILDVLIRLFKEKPMGTVGAIILLMVFFAAIFAPIITNFDPYKASPFDKLQPPSSTHIMGTDALGRDLYTRIIYGARISLYIGLGASAISVIIAILLGVISGYVGGWLDLIVQRFVDTALSIPTLVLLVTLVPLLGQGWIQIMVILGILGGIAWSRVVRGAVIGLRGYIYVQAAMAIGGDTFHIIGRHILPNILPIMIIIFSMSIGGNIMSESGLSFLGLGIPPPTPSWGQMLSAEGRRFMYEAWWLAVFPGVVLSVVIWGVNMWGDAIRDILDPRLRGGVGRYGAAEKKMKTKISREIKSVGNYNKPD